MKTSLLALLFLLASCGGGSGSSAPPSNQTGTGVIGPPPAEILDTSGYDFLARNHYIPLGVRFFEPLAPASGKPEMAIAIQNPRLVDGAIELEEYREFDQRKRYLRFVENGTDEFLYLLRGELAGETFDFETLHNEQCFEEIVGGHDFPVVAASFLNDKQLFVTSDDCTIEELRGLTLTVEQFVYSLNQVEMRFTVSDGVQSYASFTYADPDRGVTHLFENSETFSARVVRDEPILTAPDI